MVMQPVPSVLALSGLDPSGGAGILADTEAILSQGCHTCPVITTLTVQDTRQVTRTEPVEALLLVEQARAVLEDIPVRAIKIGLLGSVAQVEAIHTLLTDYPALPVVLDPVLAAGNGDPLVEEAVREALQLLLLPQVTVLTPNTPEARRLAPEADSLDACAEELLDRGCEFVLITGSHEPGSEVVNRLYGNHRLLEAFRWPRLEGSYHGSGCTLASAVAGLLAQGKEPMTAIHEAQEYTWQSLEKGYRLGLGQQIPNRLFWALDEP